MAIVKTVEINVDEKQAITGLENLEASLNKLDGNFEKFAEQSESTLGGIKKDAEEGKKGVKALSDGFKGVGLAIKAMGVGLVLQAFQVMKDLFMSNQVIADKFGATFKALSIAFNDLFDYISKNAKNVTEFFTNVFQNPIQYIEKFGELVKENIIERFNSALEVVGFLGDALKQLFEGDFDAAMKSVKEAGKELVDVVTGVDGTTDKVAELADGMLDYASNTFKAAEALQKQENAAKRAAAIQAGLVEEYDRQAELQRQIRDDEAKSIDERKKANDKLGEILAEQKKAMLQQAALQVQAAQNQYNLNKSIENEVALIDARNNVKAVEAQIEGFLSEQLVNKNALIKEGNELVQSQIDTQTEVNLRKKELLAQEEEDELTRLEKQKSILEEQRDLDLEEYERKKKLYAEGTQARTDAENEFVLKQQEISEQLTANEKEQTAARKKISEEEAKAKMAMLNAVGDGLSLAAEQLGENTVAGKAAAVAAATISTYNAIAGQLATFSGVGAPPIPGYAIAQAVVTGAFGLAQVKKILSVKTPKGGGGGSAPASISGGGSSSAPSFNLVGNAGVNQIENTIGQQPVKAYVVSNDVTSQQSLDRNIKGNATIG